MKMTEPETDEVKETPKEDTKKHLPLARCNRYASTVGVYVILNNRCIVPLLTCTSFDVKHL